MDLRATLTAEFARRRRLNPRFSLRAFARALGTHHRTLSQILEGRRRLTTRAIRRLGAGLRLGPEQVAEACLTEQCAAVLRFVGRPGFRPDARWIAVMTGIPLDAVSVALHRLLHDRRLEMRSATHWITRGE
jgi:transcriptional regulator with XRE-family HTH domain